MNLRRPLTAPNWAAALLCSFSALVGHWPGGPAAAQSPASENKKAGEVEAILRKTADFYKKTSSLAVEIDRAQKLGPMAMKSTLTIDFVRPNKLAVRTKGNLPGADIVSDGKTISVSIVALKAYTQSKAPASLDDLGADPLAKGIIMGSLHGTMLGDLISTDPYKMLMEGVKTSKYAGKEPLDGGTTHHLKFTQDQFDWEIWIAADGVPLIRKVVLDMTKSLAGSQTAAQFKGQKLEMTQTFRGWKVDAAPRENAFVFQPPAGSRKVESFTEALGGGGGHEEAASPLVDKPAPPIVLKRLEEGEFRLADHRNKDVVMVDFWATWCGPCVMELPILSEVADAYKDKGVAFLAINLKETPEQIKKFQADKKLKINVALDPEGKTGTDYGANAIPMLVLIDKTGFVRSVHVGYNPSIRTTLSKELDALIAGKEIPKAAAPTHKAPMPKSEGLKRLWSASGAYTGVATDAKGATIYALEPGGKCCVLDSGGKTTRSFALGGTSNGTLRVARRAGGGVGLLTFQSWGPSVLAVKEDGTEVWEETGGQGVDDVWPADLDGDGNDEAVVGYNGSTGLHVFSPEGKRLWKRTDMGNVWHVTAGDLDGDGKPEVITTSAQGKVHVFAAADGKPLMQLDPGFYASMVRVAPGQARPPSKGDLILVAGMKDPGQGILIAGVGADDKVHWTTALPVDVPSCDSMAVTPDGKWAAVGLRGGRVCVLDVRSGKVVASTVDQGITPAVAWGARPDGAGSQLLVATGTAVNAFATQAQDAAPRATNTSTVPPIPALAQKGAATAYAAPLSGIRIDGDLDDWPKEMVHYYILNNRVPFANYGENGLAGADLTTSPNLSPYFMAGYDPDAGLLYVAVVVRDDHLFVGFKSPWDTDAVEVYVDGTHKGRRYQGPYPDDPSVLPALQYYAVPGQGAAYGDPQGLNPAMACGSIKRTKTHMAYARTGDVTVYEWAIQVFDQFPDTPTKLLPGKRIGFDVAVVDKDSEQEKPAWVCWGPAGGLKMLDASNLGDLVLGRDP